MQQQENSAYSLRATLGGLLQIGFGAFVLGLVIIVGLAVVSNMQEDSERSLASAIGHALGEIEGSHASTMMQEEADLKHRLALAEAEVRRLSDFYAAFYQAVGVASQRASEWEGALIQQQASTVSGNNVVETIGANVLSLGCVFSVMDPDNPDAEEMCAAANSLGNSMVEEYTVLPEHRPRYVEDVLRDFPRPGDLISDEYRRVRNEFSGAYPDAD